MAILIGFSNNGMLKTFGIILSSSNILSKLDLAHMMSE